MYTGSSSTTSKFWASLSPEMRCMISTKDCVFKSQYELYNLATIACLLLYQYSVYQSFIQITFLKQEGRGQGRVFKRMT